MRKTNFLKPLILALPLALVACEKPTTTSVAGICTGAGNNPFIVTVSVTKDAKGNPVIGFTNYTLQVAPGGGKAPSPVVFVCLEGQATFDPAKTNINWQSNPGDFSKSTRANPSPTTRYIIHNTNATQGIFRYSVTVQTTDFGEMIIDPRIQNGGGGTND